MNKSTPTPASPTPDATTPGRVDPNAPVLTQQVEAMAEALFYSVDWTNKDVVWAEFANDKTTITQGVVRRFRQQAATLLSRLADATPGAAPSEGVASAVRTIHYLTDLAPAERRVLGYIHSAGHKSVTRHSVAISNLTKLGDDACIDMLVDLGLVEEIGDGHRVPEVYGLTNRGLKLFGNIRPHGGLPRDSRSVDPGPAASPSPARSDRAADRQGDGVPVGIRAFAERMADWEGAPECAPERGQDEWRQALDEVRDEINPLWDAVEAYMNHTGSTERPTRVAVVNRASKIARMMLSLSDMCGWSEYLAAAPTPAPEGVDLRAGLNALKKAAYNDGRSAGSYDRLADHVDYVLRELEAEPRLDPQADKVDALRVADPETVTASHKAVEWLNRIHYGLMDPTRPRQACGEMVAGLLAAIDEQAALDAPRDGGA